MSIWIIFIERAIVRNPRAARPGRRKSTSADHETVSGLPSGMSPFFACHTFPPIA